MDAKFIVQLSGKDYALWAGILAEAHERGLQSIETTLVQVPADDNGQTAIVKAVVTMKDGTQFTDYGDANPRNTSPAMAKALIRLASTRAKGRALRDAINVGQTMLEELGDMDDAQPRNGGQPQTPHAAARAKEAAAPGPRPPTPPATPGFEATFTKPGVRHYTRAELIEGTRKRLAEAEARGLGRPGIELERMPNDDLFTLAEALLSEIKQAKAAGEAGAEVA